MSAFESKVMDVDKQATKRKPLEILQVNLGNLCNQSCKHCHVGAGPDGKNIMSKETVDKVLDFLKKKEGLTLDVTGGAPELNPNFRYLIGNARPLVKEIIVRSNLTVLLEKGQKDLPGFYKKNKVRIICSMPCYTQKNVDEQRGEGVFEKSVNALKILNDKGYGRYPDLKIDLVYNPGGAFLPGPQEQLENDYKKHLKEEDGIDFNNLITITNAPIKRFRNILNKTNKYESYMNLLKENFNKEVVPNVMCRTLISVGWDGTLYDCDFNQALGMPIMKPGGNVPHIEDIDPDDLDGMGICFADHCFTCTAGSGSSCQGAIDGGKR